MSEGPSVIPDEGHAAVSEIVAIDTPEKAIEGLQLSQYLEKTLGGSRQIAVKAVVQVRYGKEDFAS